MARGIMLGEDSRDPIFKNLKRSAVAQTLKNARASLEHPTVPFTPMSRSLFHRVDAPIDSRPSSSYSIKQLSFLHDTFGSRPASGTSNISASPSMRSSLSAKGGLPNTISEQFGSWEGIDIFQLDDGRCQATATADSLAPRPDSADEVLIPAGSPPLRPPKLPSRSASEGALVSPGHRSHALPAARLSRGALMRIGSQTELSGPSPRKVRDGGERRDRQRASSRESGCSGLLNASPVCTPRHEWDPAFKEAVVKLQSLSSCYERERSDAVFMQMSDRIWGLVMDLQAGRSSKPGKYGAMLLRAVLSLLDSEDASCLFKLSRCALGLLQIEAATKAVRPHGVMAAYMNIAKALFKCSKNTQYDSDFVNHGLIPPLLRVLESVDSNDLRVYILGILKNISQESSSQIMLLHQGVLEILYRMIESFTEGKKEVQCLIQITAVLRNFADANYKGLLHGDRPAALVAILPRFPGHMELLTNVSRVLAHLTVHRVACEVFAADNAIVCQIVECLSAAKDWAPLVVRLAFVVGNLTERSQRVRDTLILNCAAISLVPEILVAYWQKDQLLVQGKHGGQPFVTLEDVEGVLVKLVRLVANLAVCDSARSAMASSEDVANSLLGILEAKRIASSEELVLNVVAAITSLLLHEDPSNVFAAVENRQLLCRLLRPLLLDASCNEEALVEATRALSNLSRHSDARSCMRDIRLDEVFVMFLDHCNRNLVFFSCGVLVNIFTDFDCVARLSTVGPVVSKLLKLLADAPAEDLELRAVLVKVLTNLSHLDPGLGGAVFSPAEAAEVRRLLPDMPGPDPQ